MTEVKRPLVVKQLARGQKLDFSIETLGECKFESPFIRQGRNFVSDQSEISYFHMLEGMESYRNQFGEPLPAFELAGPREKIFFKPSETTAAIVTCGGLCPGLNNVIRAITFTLNLYGVNNVLGVNYGYAGLIPGNRLNFTILNGYSISKIHTQGGTVIGSSRGPQNVREMVETLKRNNIDMLFTIGGDGTQKGAMEIVEEIKRQGLEISVVGVPKTIDNDLNFLEKTFGFETAVEAARESVNRIHAEALSCINGIGILKLMGRDSGYIAAQATLASTDINICLVPEIDFDLDGRNGLYESIIRRLNYKGHCVIAVAEGAGQRHLPLTGEKDASGNAKYGDIGKFLHQQISKYFSDHALKPTIKYVDPSYLIRSLPASANDAVFCLRLGQAAVHAAMAGKTAMVTGYWSRIFTHVPMSYTVSARKRIHPESLFWQSVLEVTRQPKDMTSHDSETPVA